MDNIIKGEKGFALVAALLAIWILTSVVMLVFALSTQDIRISSRLVGEKKAFSATEAGVHLFMQSFDPTNLSASVVSNVQVDATNDAESRYSVMQPPSGCRPISGPATLPLPGYAIGGGQQWGQDRYNVRVTGTNTRYSTFVSVDIGAGYGPVEITTAYR